MDRLSSHWPSYVRWTPPALVVLAVVFDLSTPIDYSGVPLLAVTCVFAGATMTFRQTAWIALLALAATVAVELASGRARHVIGWTEIINVLLAAAIGLDVNRVIERYVRRLQVAQSVAEALQRAVLPAPPERIGSLRVAARYEAADAEARIGGDAYAIQDTPFGVRVLIGDVRGKGVRAVTAASIMLGAFREAAHHVEDLGDLANRLEDSLSREKQLREGTERREGFVTALFAEVAPGSDTVRLVNRGHPEPYLIGADGVRPLTAVEPDLPLGMGDLHTRRSPAEVFPLSPGDVLVFVTDGVTEARNNEGSFYDPARVLREFPASGQPAPDAVIKALADDIHRWTGGPRDDDMAMLAALVT
ncbi:PP2C family protein-serine/threonine phosphatase [Streptomyces sp. NPDC051662]|uniref:PP2C family protein-serine/threonine phosphatase n=1 Tax=Streptomyces sp. NPDC051662 TaxID=3154750 RepID=UPI0034336AF7